MYSYRGYSASSKASQQRVTENGTMGRHTSSSPPPVLCDGKRRSIRDRLQGITSAMSWIKDELVSRDREREREREREAVGGGRGSLKERATCAVFVLRTGAV